VPTPSTTYQNQLIERFVSLFERYDEMIAAQELDPIAWSGHSLKANLIRWDSVVGDPPGTLARDLVWKKFIPGCRAGFLRSLKNLRFRTGGQKSIWGYTVCWRIHLDRISMDYSNRCPGTEAFGTP
jgi:hypothetical protein